jgi:hypothetical protein
MPDPVLNDGLSCMNTGSNQSLNPLKTIPEGEKTGSGANL